MALSAPHAGPTFLAIDLGASSGRGVMGTLDDGRMHMHEVHRFRTPMLERDGHLHWDIAALWHEVQLCLQRAMVLAPALRSVSVDSWGVDYVSLDAHGEPLGDPYCYRDTRTAGRLADVLREMPAEALYALTGTQFLPFNTLLQIAADLHDDPVGAGRVATRLLIADYLLYRLSGVMAIERTMASTTQLFDMTAMEWSTPLIAAIGDERSRYPQTVAPGTNLAPVLRCWLDQRPEGAGVPSVIATCSHDTAAAVAAVPVTGDEPWVYICSGTWSLVGAELVAPVLTERARLAGFTNEIGIDGTIRFLKNRTGLWVLEECVREWASQGELPGWDLLLAEATAADAGRVCLDLDEPTLAERGDMVAKLTAACARANIPSPVSRGALVRLVLESLAHGYAAVLDELESLSGERAAVVHVVGGGARNTLLNQLTADACGRRLVAGPDEATVLGNLLLQARTAGVLQADVSLRDVARRSTRVTEFTPRRAPSDRTAALAVR